MSKEIQKIATKLQKLQENVAKANEQLIELVAALGKASDAQPSSQAGKADKKAETKADKKAESKADKKAGKAESKADKKAGKAESKADKKAGKADKDSKAESKADKKAGKRVNKKVSAE